MELYITAAFDKSLSSMIVSLGTDGYKVRKTNIDYYFRNVDLVITSYSIHYTKLYDNVVFDPSGAVVRTGEQVELGGGR